LAAYCQVRRDAGWRVVIGTVLPRADLGPESNFEARRQSLNRQIRSNWPSFADALADIGSDPIMGQAEQTRNPMYYGADGVHLTAAGYALIAAAHVSPAINRL
jgi:lysophospholipase L1-like esterase